MRRVAHAVLDRLVLELEMLLELRLDALVGAAADDDDVEVVADQPVAREVDERGRQQAARKVSRAAEDHQCRGGRGIARHDLRDRHYCGISTWPPKPWRIAESSLSPNVLSLRER